MLFFLLLAVLLAILLEVLKIALLSAVYTFITLAPGYLFLKITKREAGSASKFKPVFWSLCLLSCAFCFTYYGDRGWWQDAYLPIGFGKKIANTEDMTYFDLQENGATDIDAFLVRNDHLCFSSGAACFVYNLATGKSDRFDNHRGYDNYASAHHLPLVKEFQAFWPQYNAYWNGWRVWLLP
jgi:energy-coupling factor transporter transmembrane protein EcfT